MGLSASQIADVVSADPRILTRVSIHFIERSVTVLKKVLCDKLYDSRILKNFGWFLNCDLDKTLVPNVEYMRSCGIEQSQILQLFYNYPRFLLHKEENFKQFVRRVDEMGVDRESKLKFNVFALSERKIKETAEFLRSSGRFDNSYIFRYPYVLIFSLDRRLKPRLRVLEIWEREKILEFKPVFSISDSKFLAKFVKPHLDKFEDLSFLAKRLRGIHYSSSSQMYPYAVMSSISSAVTYTSVYTDSEPGRVFWGADEEISDGGSPRVIVYGYDGLPMQPAQDPDYVLEPMYPEYIQLEDEHVFPAEEQPLPPVDSPTAESPGYVAESDPEEDPEEYEDDETEDGPVDYPMDGGDDGDDDDGDSSGDDADDEDEDEEDEEEKEHPAPADSAVVVPTVEPVSPPKGTEPGETLLGYCRHYHHLHYHHYHHLYTYHPPVDRRDDFPESELPPHKRLCLSTLGPRYEIGESSTARPIRGRGIDYGFVSTVDAEARRQGIDEVGYGIRDTLVDPAEAVPEIAPMTVGEVNTRVTELTELHERDTQDLYALLEDAQDGRTRISQQPHQELLTHRDHVYAHETHIQGHQAQLQLQSTLI
ncbi:putative reverse transcriptase domain-containing protein [Tanacetum coccineum]|uniref:Reverse transcriptase domain-containing protein n=1 Tax=Tanacetum coccineum TaxID=301880 RepID=A0ABQ5BA32_9ASTR